MQPEAVELEIKRLRPNQWFLNQVKVEAIRAVWSQGKSGTLPPVLVSVIDDEWSLIDGHSRAFVALENGLSSIQVQVRRLKEIEGSSELYEFLHRTGPKRGVTSLTDLADRILLSEDFHKKWISYCESNPHLEGRW